MRRRVRAGLASMERIHAASPAARCPGPSRVRYIVKQESQ
jgi:hypothetical protein